MPDTNTAPAEIVRLHQFFEDWYNGAANRSIGEFADALDPAFFIVSPDGAISNKDEVVRMVSTGQQSGPIQIRVENVQSRHIDQAGMHVLTYEEHQKRSGESTAMLSTVGFVVDEVCPGGYRWLFVHETWQNDRRTN